MASIIMLGLLSTAYSVTGISAVLSSQNPDPVSPGNFVFVNVKVSNTGDEPTSDTIVSILENDVFSIAQGESRSKNLGPISPNSRGSIGDEEGFDIAKFKLFVDENAPTGLNTLEIEVEEFGKIYTYEFDVLVQDTNPRLQINSFDIERTQPGETSTLSIEVENINGVTLRDVFVTLDIEEVTDEVLSVLKGSNQKVISTIEPGQKELIKFEIVVDPSADAKPYLLPVTMNFEDSLDNSYSTEVVGSVKVYSPPVLSLQIDSQEKYSEGAGKITLAIANPGTSTIKGTRIEILEEEGYDVIEGSTQYIGDLNPDDFQTVQSRVNVKSDAAVLRVKLEYLDSYNEEKEEIIGLPIKVFSEEQLREFEGGSSSGGGIGGSIFTLVLLIIAFYVGRHFGKKSHLKKK